MAQLYDLALSLLTDPKHTRWIALLLVSFELLLCGGIILKIPYTEIDWETYMIQVQKFLPPNPEYDYRKLEGPTGPLVYPAIHVYIYSALYRVTDAGKDIRLAQILFTGLYVLTISVVLACYKRVNAPPWLLATLVLSKRLHSIFLLRLFNDCWATFFFWTAVYAATRRQWLAAGLLWTIGVGVKMVLLLVLPGLAMVLVQGAGLDRAIFIGVIAVLTQLVTAAPFLSYDPAAYFGRAFEFSRQFLYKWTVNWRFVDEETFLSKPFAYGLLAMHLVILITVAQQRWIRPTSDTIPGFIKIHLSSLLKTDRSTHNNITRKISPVFVMDVMLGSMVIGLLCARSLHYQFFAYLGWTSPYLLWRSGAHPALVVIGWAIQEYGWLVFPSTKLSSGLVVTSLALQVISASGIS